MTPMKTVASVLLLASAGWALTCAADSREAQCEIYPKGEDKLDKAVACTFSQRQGHITITRADGVAYDLKPAGSAPGQYQDQHGRPAHRQDGLGSDGLIFRLAHESVYVYWGAPAQGASDADNATAPFSIKDYDATTLLRCKAAGDKEYGTCPAGVARMEDRQASVTVQSQLGKRFTINFMTGYVNATNRQVEARLEGDTWIVKCDNGEVYEVPLAAIEGG